MRRNNEFIKSIAIRFLITWLLIPGVVFSYSFLHSGIVLGQSVSDAKTKSEPSRSGSITGIVMSDDGHPVVDAGVYARLPGEVTGAITRISTTDTNGRFQLDGLTPGSYDVNVLMPGYVLIPNSSSGENKTMYYRPGDEITLKIRVHPIWGLVGIGMRLGLPILFAYRAWKTKRLLE